MTIIRKSNINAGSHERWKNQHLPAPTPQGACGAVREGAPGQSGGERGAVGSPVKFLPIHF